MKKRVNEAREIINYIEDKDIIIDDRWFYHFSSFDINRYRYILKSGIRSRFNLDRSIYIDYSWNGSFYISVTKGLIHEKDDKSRIWSLFYPDIPAFIIDEKVKAYKCRYVDYLNLFALLIANSPLPIRMSDYVDEWQVFSLIKPTDIIGLQYAISKLVTYDLCNFKNLVDMVKLLSEINLDLPIYDFGTCKEINKRKCLELSL